MANEQELKSLRIRRGTIKSAVTRVSNFVRDFGDGNIFQLKTRLVNLREAFKEFDAVQLQIEVLDETALQGNERADFENAYYNIESTILEKIETATVNEAATIANATGFTPSVSSHGTGNSNVRLPILELPTFSGNYRDWLSFRDTFTALIHDSNLYTSIEKFHYLRSCLKDEALKAIESIAVSEANYRVAWETLITRFENKRLIIQEHAYAIINLPPLVKNSYQSLRKLVDDFNINLAALTNLGQPTEHWSGLLVPIISQKMDFFTKREWEAQLGPDPPTVETLKSFLQKKCVTLESLSVAEQQSAKTNNATPKSNNKTSANHFSKDRTLCNASTNKQIQCYMCKEAHGLYQCPQFLNLVIAQRVTQVKEWKVCENCFRKGHEASQCKSRACRYCKEKHNSLLHVENNVQTSVVTYSSVGKAKQNLLATAEILIRDSQGNWQRCRGLLDPGSQSNFISEETVKRLGIGTKPVNWPITTVEGLQGCARQLAQIHFKSLHNPFNAHIDCLVLNKITEELPLSSFEFESRQIPGNINLADPEFNVSRKVDVLLGSSIFWRVLSVGQIKATRNNPHLQETILGWVVGGDMVAGRKPSYGTLCNVSLNSINKQLPKFWDVDEYPTNKRVVIVKKEDIECETHFKNTCSRNAEGRFTVEIPFKLNGPNIGVSKEMAIKRFLSLENKFRKNPFIDNSGMIRVGGRLSNSQYPHDKKYPIVLPKGHVTRLILENTHRDQLHAGPTATLAAVREKFWPLDGRSEIRKVVHRCIPCFRTKPHDNNPIMGNLPSHRVKASRPFTNCGVDFGGPIFLKIGGIRSKKTTKAYICLFVCFSTKAIHLELVSDLTAANFLNGLKRFIARRGMVANIYSDNATNFVGAQRDLRDVFLADEFGNIVLRHLAEFNINWHFIPARSPHFGGLWEAGIKAVKGHIKRVIGQTSLTYEEMYTLLTGIEACLNSRPLCPLTEDPSDLNVLTPGHFLIGTAMTSPLEHQIVDVPQNRLTRWQHLEQMRQHFWNRWSKEYVGQLQERPKWQKGNSSAAIKEGDLVVLKEVTPPLTWKLGRVTAVHPGADDIIRVATVKTDSGTTKRAVRNLCVLPIDD
jgi:hypothetical protein